MSKVRAEVFVGLEAGGEQRGVNPGNVSKHIKAVPLWDVNLA